MFVGGFMSYLLYLCLFVYSGVQHIFCRAFVLFFFVLCTLCCQFLCIVHFWLPLLILSIVFISTPKYNIIIYLIKTYMLFFFFVFFHYECTWWTIFPKSVMRTKFDIYFFIIKIIVLEFCRRLLFLKVQ